MITGGSTPIWAPQSAHDGSFPKWGFARREFAVRDVEITSARLSACASSTEQTYQYVYKAFVNNEFAVLGPVRAIETESRVDEVDVTGLLRPGGANAIGVVFHTLSEYRFHAELVIAYADGTTETVGTGPDWSAMSGMEVYPDAGDIGGVCFTAPVENLNGLKYPRGFSAPGFDDSGWQPAIVRPAFEKLQPSTIGIVTQEYPAPETSYRRDGGTLFVDFGRSWVGGARLDITAAAGDRIELRFGEITSPDWDVRHELSTGNVYRDVWTLAEGTQTLETWGARVFRYLSIRVLSGHPEINSVAAVALVYPLKKGRARFSSSNETLNRIWDLSAHTIRAMNLNLYVDSWTRERIPYEADIYLQQRAHACLDTDARLGRYSVDYVIGNRTWPTEWPLYVILAAHDSWWSTGDASQITAQYSALAKILPDSWLDPGTGLVRKPVGTKGEMDVDLVDWPPGERDDYEFLQINTVVNALCYRAYRNMATISRALGHLDDSARYRRVADRLRESMNTLLFDAQAGIFADGLDDSGVRSAHHAVHASLFPLWSGVVNTEHADSIIEFLRGRGMACSPYAAAFLLEGLWMWGAGETALDLLTGDSQRSWSNMLRVGAGATMEAWDVEFKPNLSYSHPWSASPVFLMAQGLFGIRALSPGFRTFVVAPQLSGLREASVTLPTVAGTISASASSGDAGQLDVVLDVPEETEATLRLPDHGSRIEVNGRAVALRREGWSEISLAAGRHEITSIPAN